jgi:hypothetical protein
MIWCQIENVLPLHYCSLWFFSLSKSRWISFTHISIGLKFAYNNLCLELVLSFNHKLDLIRFLSLAPYPWYIGFGLLMFYYFIQNNSLHVMKCMLSGSMKVIEVHNEAWSMCGSFVHYWWLPWLWDYRFPYGWVHMYNIMWTYADMLVHFFFVREYFVMSWKSVQKKKLYCMDGLYLKYSILLMLACSLS